MNSVKFDRPLEFVPINQVEPTSDMEGTRIYNKAPIPGTDFVKGWYEVVNAGGEYIWQLVQEGGGDISFDPAAELGMSLISARSDDDPEAGPYTGYEWGSAGIKLLTAYEAPTKVGVIVYYNGPADTTNSMYNGNFYISVANGSSFKWVPYDKEKKYHFIDLGSEESGTITDDQKIKIVNEAHNCIISYNNAPCFYVEETSGVYKYCGFWQTGVNGDYTTPTLYSTYVTINTTSGEWTAEEQTYINVPKAPHEGMVLQSIPREDETENLEDTKWSWLGVSKFTEATYRDPYPEEEDSFMVWCDPDTPTLGMKKDKLYIAKNYKVGALDRYGWVEYTRVPEEEYFVGDIKPWFGTKESIPNGWLPCDGAELYNASAFIELYAVISDLYNQPGDPNGKFRTPDLRGKFLQGCDALHSHGDIVPAGLPNIKAAIDGDEVGYGPIAVMAGGQVPTGAFVNRSGGGTYTVGSGGATTKSFNFDASKGQVKTDSETASKVVYATGDEIVYGKSDTVQPPALQVMFIIRALPAKVNTTTEDLIIGDIRAFATNEISDNWIICDGSKYEIADYRELYEVIGHTYAQDGDDAESDYPYTFRVPDLVDRFIQGTAEIGDTNEPIAAGLPNITGGIRDNVSTGLIRPKSQVGEWQEGAFYKDSDSLQSTAQYVGGSSASTLRFDASKSNDIYGNSDTVQPPAYKFVYAIRARYSPIRVNSSTVEITRKWKGTRTTTDSTKWIDVNTYLNFEFIQIGRHCTLTATSDGTPTANFPTNYAFISYDELDSQGIPYPSSWKDTPLNTVINIPGVGSSTNGVGTIIANAGGIGCNQTISKNWCKFIVTWIADTSVDTGHFIHINHTPTDGEMLVYNGSINMFEPVGPIDITNDVTVQSPITKNNLTCYKMGKMVYLTFRSESGATGKTVTLPSDCLSVVTGYVGIAVTNGDFGQISAIKGSNVLTIGNVNGTIYCHAAIPIQ